MNIRALKTATALVAILGAMVTTGAQAADAAALEEGKRIAFDKKLGNCLACHSIPGGEMGGTIGPPIIAMSARFPDKAVLRAQIYDATVKNPNSAMPPFGRHKALTDKEIDLVTDFIHSL
jgi:sulfur-oxidizing protein SoxX